MKQAANATTSKSIDTRYRNATEQHVIIRAIHHDVLEVKAFTLLHVFGETNGAVSGG